jgi:ATP-dependent RNA helicase RhlE
LAHLIQSGRIDRALVFVRTKHGAQRLADALFRDGISAAAIHGDRTQGQRVRALDDFKEGRVAILVATEVAARGLDIDGLPHVVNFELPTVPEDYIHRIGRTGRAGMEGDAVSLVCLEELELLNDIESLLRKRIRDELIPGFELDRRASADGERQVRSYATGGRSRPGASRSADPRGPRRRSSRPGAPRSVDGRSAAPYGSAARSGAMYPSGHPNGTARASRPAAAQGSSMTVLPGETFARDRAAG